jgi:hypothetical protein
MEFQMIAGLAYWSGCGSDVCGVKIARCAV